MSGKEEKKKTHLQTKLVVLNLHLQVVFKQNHLQINTSLFQTERQVTWIMAL